MAGHVKTAVVRRGRVRIALAGLGVFLVDPAGGPLDGRGVVEDDVIGHRPSPGANPVEDATTLLVQSCVRAKCQVFESPARSTVAVV
jgi:hypothetical protein